MPPVAELKYFARKTLKKRPTGADVVYTDVWTSMGQEAESEERRQVFAGYQITEDILAQAKEDVIFMHPLPAHHGEEVTEDVLDSPSFGGL